MIKNKEVNYYIWNDEPIKADYYDHVDLPHGGKIYSIIGQVLIEKGDLVYIDYGSSFLQQTRSGKGPQSQFPYGKVHLHGIPANVVLEESKCTTFTKSSQEDFNLLVEKQVAKITPLIPEMRHCFIEQYMNNAKKIADNKLKTQSQNKLLVSNAIDKMNAFFKKNTP